MGVKNNNQCTDIKIINYMQISLFVKRLLLEHLMMVLKGRGGALWCDIEERDLLQSVLAPATDRYSGTIAGSVRK